MCLISSNFTCQFGMMMFFVYIGKLLLSTPHYVDGSKFVFTWSRVFQYIKPLFSTFVTHIYTAIVKCICSASLYLYYDSTMECDKKTENWRQIINTPHLSGRSKSESNGK